MDIVKKIARNTTIIIAGYIMVGLVGMITTVYMARYLGVDRFGTFLFVLTYVGFFALIIELGANNQILVREISQDRAKAGKLVGNAIVIKILFSVFTALVCCAVIGFSRYSFQVKTLVYIASLSFLLSAGGVYVSVFRSNLKMVYPTATDILGALLKLGFFLYLIQVKAPLILFVAAVVLVNLPVFFLNLMLSRRLIRPEFKIDFTVWKKLIAESWPLVLTAAFFMIYTRIDQLMLFQMKGAQAVGYYSAAVRLVEMLSLVPGAFMLSVFPFMSEYFKTSDHSFAKSYRLAFKYMMLIMMPVAVGTTLLSGQIIEFFYGRAFVTSAAALAILVWSEVWVFVGIVNGGVLIAANQQKMNFVFTSISAVINVVLNLILIPRYSFIGSSIAIVISYAVGQAICYIYPKTRDYAFASYKSMVKPFLASAIMGAFVYYLPWRAHIAIPLGALTYCVAIFLIKGVNKEDIGLMRGLLTYEKPA